MRLCWRECPWFKELGGGGEGGKAVKMFSDSRLVVSQVKGELEARDERRKGYLS